MTSLYKFHLQTEHTRGIADGSKLSLYSNPPGKRFLATAFNIVQGFKSDARPILRYMDPG